MIFNHETVFTRFYLLHDFEFSRSPFRGRTKEYETMLTTAALILKFSSCIGPCSSRLCISCANKSQFRDKLKAQKMSGTHKN